MIRQSSFHCRRDAQGLVDAAEVVVGMVNRNHVAVILELLRKRVRQASKSPNTHPQIKVLPLGIAR